MLSLFGAPLAGVAWTGCSSGGYACDLPLTLPLETAGPTSLCEEFDKASAQATCVALGGSAVPSCPTGELIGTCEALYDGEPITVTYYGEAASTAMNGCLAAHGTWSSP